MARSPADATRFTATGPYASSRASTLDLSAPPPPNETPAQKVVRLREAARRARFSELSAWDKTILRGRTIADNAHKITATALMGASVLCLVLGTVALGEQISHNRKKKKEFYAEQQRNYDHAVALARQAEAEGKLTDDLMLFLNKERAMEQAEAEKKAQGSILSRIRKSVWGDMATEEAAGGRLGLASTEAKHSVAERVRRVNVNSTSSSESILASTGAGEEEEPSSHVASNRGSGSAKGGPLDRLGANAASALTSSPWSWTNWWRGR